MHLRLRKSIDEVVLIFRDDQDRRRVRTVFRKSRKSKKGTGPVHSIGRVVRKIVSSHEDAVKTYLHRHDESNREKKDGWLRELSYNVFRATRRGTRKLQRDIGLPSIDID